MLAFLLIPILLLAVVSCELDALSDFMGQAGTNAYVEGGLVVIDTSQGAAVVSSVGSLDAIDTSTPEGEAAYAAEVETVKTAIAEALTSTTKTEALIEELAKPLTSPVPDKVTDTVAAIETELGITIADPTTEGDLVTLVLVVEVYEKASSPEITAILAKPEADRTEADQEQLIELVSEALQVVETVQTVSTAGSINLDDILGGLIEDPALLELLGRSSATRDITREGEEDDPMAFIAPIFNSIINSIGKDASGNIDSAELTRAISSFGVIRTAYEQMAPALPPYDVLRARGMELGLTDVTNYLLSVIFTEADSFFKAYDTLSKNTELTDVTIDFEIAINEAIDYMESEDTTDLVNLGQIDWEIAAQYYMGDLKKATFLTVDGETVTEGTVITTIRLLADAAGATYVDGLVDDLISSLLGGE
jgi:hypothetical protein